MDSISNGRHTTERQGGSLVAIGLTGRAPGMDALDGYDRVLVIDPLARNIANLPETADRLEGVVAHEADTVDVDSYNVPGLAAVEGPTDALRALFPGLQRLRRISAPALSPDKLRTMLDDLPQPLDIWIDAPGREQIVLAALEGITEGLRHLVVRGATAPMFQGQATELALEAWAQKNDLRMEAADRADPDRPLISWRVDPTAQELRRVQDQCEALREERDDARRQLVTARAEAAERTAALTSELDAARAGIARHMEKVTQLQSDLAAARQGEESARANESQRNDDLKQALRKAQDDLSVAIRAQASTAADCEDLRSRYREIEQTCNRQGDLLRALTAKLQQAAHHLQEVALSGPKNDDAAR